MAESKHLGILVIIIALVWGFEPIMDRVNALTANGGLWALWPDIMPLVLVGAVALVIVVGIAILWDTPY